VAVGCLLLALGGRISAHYIPPLAAGAPQLKINFNAFSETWRNLKLAHTNRVVFRSLLGISWMWFMGAAILSLFPMMARDVLHGDEQVASLLLGMFSIGIGAGSLLCEKLSRRHVEIGLVPLGALGMSIFVIDLAWSLGAVPDAAALMSIGQFLAVSANWRVLADLVLLALSAGVFSVPMYALIQLRCPPEHRARIIASGNILSALFMVASALIVGSLLGAGWSLGAVFLALGLSNLVVAALIFLMVPEYLLRFLAWVLTWCVYRFRLKGDEHIPTKGAAVLACNHVSFADAVLLMCASPRPVRFLMDREIFNMPVIGTVFRLCKAIPVCSPREDQAAYQRALEQAVQVLRDGGLLGIFPEGQLTRDGNITEFKAGLVKILAAEPAPVIPMALQNLWGSYFSRIEGRAMSKPFRRGLWSHVGLNVGAPLAAEGLTMRRLREEVERLHEERVY
jgi:1-acyl-sn-glycerol-3-phosphate acyltransferase